MRNIRVWVAVFSAVLVMALIVAAQSGRKPGLWEITSTMTWQQSPFPSGMQMPANSPFGGGPHTSQVCVTQEMIDRYGAPVPQSRGNCQMTNVTKGASSMTADWTCTGQMNGKGTVESSWTDDGHSKSKVHFSGTLQMGKDSKPVEWTMESASAYQGADCGSVKPMPMPAK